MKKKKSKQNWLAYNELRYEKNPSKRPTKKVKNIKDLMLFLLKFIFSYLYEIIMFVFYYYYLILQFTNCCVKQTGFLGLCGERVDAIEFYREEIERLSKEVSLYMYFLW